MQHVQHVALPQISAISDSSHWAPNLHLRMFTNLAPKQTSRHTDLQTYRQTDSQPGSQSPKQKTTDKQHTDTEGLHVFRFRFRFIMHNAYCKHVSDTRNHTIHTLFYGRRLILIVCLSRFNLNISANVACCTLQYMCPHEHKQFAVTAVMLLLLLLLLTPTATTMTTTATATLSPNSRHRCHILPLTRIATALVSVGCVYKNKTTPKCATADTATSWTGDWHWRWRWRRRRRWRWCK